MSLLRKCDAALMVLIGLALIAAVVIATVSPEYFSLVFAAEDRLVENGTALFLLVASVVLAVNAVSLWRRGRHGAALLTAIERHASAHGGRLMIGAITATNAASPGPITA